MSEVNTEKSKEATPAKVKVDPKKADWNKLAGVKKKPQNNWLKLAKKYLFYKQAGRWFVGMVVVPWSLAATYYIGIASDRYVSDSQFMVEKNEGGGGSIDGLSLFGVTPQASNDQKILEAFIASPDMMLYLDQQIGLKEHYMNLADPLSRLSPDASYESFLKFYQEHIRIYFNDSNGLLELEVQGFTPAYAQRLSKAILARSEAFVNEIGHKLAGEQLKFVEGEVKTAEARLKDLTAKLLAFQNKTGLLSATDQGAALSGIMNELQGELVRNQTELETLTSYLNENSPQVTALKQRIAALQSQINKETDRLTDDDKLSINDLSARQQELQLDLDLATKAYTSSLIALESARTEASRKLKQLVVVSSPQLSQDAKYPRVVYALTNILLVLIMLYALIRMIRATIREHKD